MSWQLAPGKNHSNIVVMSAPCVFENVSIYRIIYQKVVLFRAKFNIQVAEKN